MSNLKTKRVQIGDHSTATNNFVMHQSDTPDGKVHISNGTLDDHTSKMTLAHDGKLGVGTDSPTSGLHVQTDTNPVMKVSRGTNNAANINLYYNTTFKGQVSGAADAFQLSSVGSSTPMQFYTDGSKNMEIDENGYVTKPNQPGFNVRFNTSNSTSPTGIDTVKFNQIVTNIGSHYSTSTGRFTAPVSGLYQFNLSIYFQNGTNYVGSMLVRSDGTVYYNFSSVGPDVMVYTSQAVYLNQNDYMYTRTYCGGNTTTLRQYSYFSGHLIG